MSFTDPLNARERLVSFYDETDDGLYLTERRGERVTRNRVATKPARKRHWAFRFILVCLLGAFLLIVGAVGTYGFFDILHSVEQGHSSSADAYFLSEKVAYGAANALVERFTLYISFSVSSFAVFVLGLFLVTDFSDFPGVPLLHAKPRIYIKPVALASVGIGVICAILLDPLLFFLAEIPWKLWNGWLVGAGVPFGIYLLIQSGRHFRGVFRNARAEEWHIKQAQKQWQSEEMARNV